MDTLEAIHTRRSIRQYTNQPVPEETVTELLKAAMAAPSVRNQQPWELVVITDAELMRLGDHVQPTAVDIIGRADRVAGFLRA